MKARQQVNLYRFFKTPQTPTSLLSWRRFMLSNIFFIFFLSLALFYDYLSLYHLRNIKKFKQHQVASGQTTFTTLKATFPAFLFEQNAAESLQRLEAELKAKDELLEAVTKRMLFSDYLTLFSRLIIENVWLSEILIEKNGMEITLKGNSIGVLNLQKFLNALLSDSHFQDYTLNIKGIENKDQNDTTSKINFEISLAKK